MVSWNLLRIYFACEFAPRDMLSPSQTQYILAKPLTGQARDPALEPSRQPVVLLWFAPVAFACKNNVYFGDSGSS